MKKLFLLIIPVFLFITAATMAQTIKMNEIYSRGGGTVYTDPDWIEIYNSGNTSADISGYKIYDSGGQGGTKPKMTFAAGTIIPAKGFLAVVTDISTSTDPSGFGLSSSGEQVWLEDAAGTVIDNVTFPAMAETQTYSRIANGSTWGLVSVMTRGLSNSIIVMNEIYSRGGSTAHPEADWVELYNSSSATVDISGYKIYDSGGQAGTKPKMTLAAGTTIAAKGFLVITTDISTSTDPSGFGLSSSGEEVWLEDNTGVVIDDYTFDAMTETQSYSRVPNGGTFYLVNTVTRGTANQSTVAVEKESKELPSGFALLQNYPNPFNPSTIISFQLPAESFVELKVFDAIGREVTTLVNETKSPGYHQVKFDAGKLSSGIYFYQLKSSNFTQVRKLMFLK